MQMQSMLVRSEWQRTDHAAENDGTEIQSLAEDIPCDDEVAGACTKRPRLGSTAVGIRAAALALRRKSATMDYFKSTKAEEKRNTRIEGEVQNERERREGQEDFGWFAVESSVAKQGVDRSEHSRIISLCHLYAI